MNSEKSKQRFYAALLILGSCFMLYRTIALLYGGVLRLNVWWVSVFLFMEMAIDACCLITSIRWWIANDKSKESLPLRFGAAVALFHAFRVLIFVLGRTGPWVNFDVRPEHWALHATTWNWTQVYFASVMSVLGIIGVIVIWTFRRRRRKSPKAK